jgi:hypothetical protein
MPIAVSRPHPPSVIRQTGITIPGSSSPNCSVIHLHYHTLTTGNPTALKVFFTFAVEFICYFKHLRLVFVILIFKGVTRKEQQCLREKSELQSLVKCSENEMLFLAPRA